MTDLANDPFKSITRGKQTMLISFSRRQQLNLDCIFVFQAKPQKEQTKKFTRSVARCHASGERKEKSTTGEVRLNVGWISPSKVRMLTQKSSFNKRHHYWTEKVDGWSSKLLERRCHRREVSKTFVSLNVVLVLCEENEFKQISTKLELFVLTMFRRCWRRSDIQCISNKFRQLNANLENDNIMLFILQYCKNKTWGKEQYRLRDIAKSQTIIAAFSLYLYIKVKSKMRLKIDYKCGAPEQKVS